MEACTLCRTDLGPLLLSGPHWRLVLDHNQTLLGSCMLVLRRHEEAVPHLTLAEWADLHVCLTATATLLQEAFAPDHFNYAFLQNQDRHVHMHIIPRYAQPRSMFGLIFSDPDYPHHYAVPAPAPQRWLADDELVALAQYLQSFLVW